MDEVVDINNSNKRKKCRMRIITIDEINGGGGLKTGGKRTIGTMRTFNKEVC